MKRSLTAVVSACLLVLAGCGGSHHHHTTRTLTPGAQHAYQTQWGPSAHSPTFGLPPRGAQLAQPPVATGVPTVEMFDSVTISQIPSSAVAVAGYPFGRFPTFGPLEAAFPHARHVSIAINAFEFVFQGKPIECLDVEPFDAVPSQAGPWDKHQLALGQKPCDYGSLSEWPQIRASIAAAGISRSQVFEWDANWTFTQHLDAGFDATQWTDHSLGRNLDESTVTPAFLGVVPTPPPPPKPNPSLTKWRNARNLAFNLYHAKRCPQPQGDVYCSHFGAQVVSNQTKLWTVVPRWSCFGRHVTTATKNTYVCWVVRPEVSYWSHARAATQKAYALNGCDGPVSFPRPVHSRLCDVLRQREHWFDQKATATVRTYS